MREQRQKIVSTVKDCESLEQKSAQSIRQVKAKCGNPLVYLVLDIIENDARQHQRLLEFIVNSLEREPLTLSPDEVGGIMELIRDHTQLKAQMIQKMEKLLETTKDKSLHIQEFLLKTLLADEKKHQGMLEGIAEVMQGLYPYWPH